MFDHDIVLTLDLNCPSSTLLIVPVPRPVLAGVSSHFLSFSGGLSLLAQSFLSPPAVARNAPEALLLRAEGATEGAVILPQVPHGVLPHDGSLLAHLLDLSHQTPSHPHQGDTLLPLHCVQHGDRAGTRGCGFITSHVTVM